MSILQNADSLINGDRQQSYGHPSKNLSHIAAQWSSYLAMRHGLVFALSAEDVCWMMALLKMCRQLHKANPENLIDAAGYIGLIELLNEKEEG
jgi:hypothetical protein